MNTTKRYKPTTSPNAIRQPIVVDTSVFTNPDCYKRLGPTSASALKNVLKHVSEHHNPLFITHGCWVELQGFVDFSKIDKRLLSTIHVQSPDRDFIRLSGTFLYEIITDMRKRGDASLKYATKVVRESYATIPEERKKGSPEPVTPFINRLRDGLRHHMRNGFIDSGEDLDTLLLARQLSGRLATGDHGMQIWANRLGVELLDVSLLLSI